MKKEKEEFKKLAEKFADSVHPVSLKFQYTLNPNIHYESTSKGLSKKEYFAGLFLAQMGNNPGSSSTHAEKAVRYANELLKVLSEEK